MISSFLRGIGVGAAGALLLFSFADLHIATVVSMLIAVAGLALSLLTRD